MANTHSSAILRSGIALIAAGAMLVPTSMASASQPSQQTDGEAKTSLSPKGDDPDALLKPIKNGKPVSATASKKTAGVGVTDAAPKMVTVVVQMDGSNPGIPWYKSLFGTTQQDRHAYLKNQIRALAERSPKVTTKSRAAAASFEEKYDYTHAIDGFAVKVSSALLPQIQKMAGVKRAFISEDHPIPKDEGEQPTPKNQSSLHMTEAEQATQKGDGQVVAVVDTGLDTDHEAFKGDLNDKTVKETKSSIDALKKQLNAGKNGRYVSEKIPFVYDYADNDDDVRPSSTAGMEHGTHVAGIATANSGQIRGTAPNAQLMMLKVGNDASGSLPDAAILAALDDAVVLKPDSLNMSLGTDAGFTDAAAITFGDALQKIRANGTVLDISAGNAYSAALSNKSGQDKPYANDPDYGVVGTPSTLADAFSVASVNNSLLDGAFLLKNGQAVGYSNARLNNGADAAQFENLKDGDYPLVDGGVGATGEVENLKKQYPDGLAGKIIVVRKNGTDTNGLALTTSLAYQNVAVLKPAAVVFYDDVDEPMRQISVSDDTIPAVVIAKRYGDMLLKSTDRTIVVKKGATPANDGDFVMSDYSSWGSTPDLKIKPEIAAPGGNIWSSVPGNEYEYMSGTSMAAPQMTGISAQIREYIDSNKKFASLSDRQKGDLVTTLLMSTAKPITDSDTKTYYSPRKQGAGLANVVSATSTDVYLTSDKTSDAARPKGELGANTDGKWSYTLTLHNVGDKTRTFTPDSAALSDQIKDGFFQLAESNWTGKGIDISYSGDAYKDGKVSVPANGTSQLTVTITVQQAFKDFAKAAPNGTTVDGFALLKSDDGGQDLTSPFLAFYGDWNKATLFDTNMSDTGDKAPHVFGSGIVNGSTGTYLGINPLVDDTTPDEYLAYHPDRAVVSNSLASKAPTRALPATGLLRNAKTLDYKYTDENGKTISTYNEQYIIKSTFNQSLGSMNYSEQQMSEKPYFTGTDANGDALPEGQYTLEKTGTTVNKDAKTETAEPISFTLDTTAPKITDFKATGSGADRKFTFSVTDNTWVAAFDFHDPETLGYFYRAYADEPATTNPDGTRTWRFTVSMTDLQEAWVKAGFPAMMMPNEMPVYAWDYGLNASAPATAIANPVKLTGIKPSSSKVDLVPGQSTKLTATLEPADTTQTALKWTSSDDSVVKVADDGTLTALKIGKATVTVASAEDPSIKATVEVSVNPVSDETGIILTQDSLTLKYGEDHKISALLADSLADADVTWESSDKSIVTVAAGSTDGTTANTTLTAGHKFGNATVTASVTGKDGKARKATLKVLVRQANYGDFIIDANGTLTNYVGKGGDVEIPGDVTAIGDQAFAGSQITSLTVPAQVKSIGSQAFAKTAKLAKVTFEGADDGTSQLNTIGGYAFEFTSKLQSVRIPDSVTTIGDGAFEVSGLRSIVLPAGLTALSDFVLYGTAYLTDITMPDGITRIGDQALAHSSASDFTIISADGSRKTGLPSKLTTIGQAAFTDMPLTKVVLPASVKSIDAGAFADDKLLTDIKLNDGLTSLGSQVFDSTGITDLTVPDSVTTFVAPPSYRYAQPFARMTALKTITLGKGIPVSSFDGNIFAEDKSLTAINVPEDSPNLKVVDGVLFSKDGKKLYAYPNARESGGSYTVPDGTETIGVGAFYKNNSLRGVKFPDSLRSISDSAFEMSSLDELKLPETFETIGVNAFHQVTTLKSVDLGGTKTVGDTAFNDDYSMTKLNLRSDLNRLQSVGISAFWNTGIFSVDMPDSLSDVKSFAFANCANLTKMHLGAGFTSDFPNVFSGQNLTSFTISDKNPVYYAENNIIYGKKDDGLHLELSLRTNGLRDYTVKAGVVAIDNVAFNQNTTLERIVLPEGLRSIGTNAFNKCTALKEVVFPDSLQTVSTYAFKETNIDVADFGTKIQTIDSDAFNTHVPTHIIVRGGDNGMFTDSMPQDDSRTKTAYFGKGMTSLTFSSDLVPDTLVVPEDLQDFTTSAEQVDPDKFVAYAPAGSDGYNVMADALAQLGLDSSHLKAYTPLAVTVKGEGDVTAGGKVNVTAAATGGVDGAKEYRFVETAADGSTKVVRDWSDDATFAWTVPADGTHGLRVDARDATWLSVSATLGNVAAPTFEQNLDTAEADQLAGKVTPLQVKATAAKDATLTYQWYMDGKAIDGQTADTFTPSATGRHEYYVVATAAKDGLTASAKSNVKPVNVVAAAAAPKIVKDLQPEVAVTVGAKTTLSVDASTSDGGQLTYQWYERTDAGDQPIKGANASSYEPDVTKVGARKYFVRVTNTLGFTANTATVDSTVATVTVKADVAALSKAVDAAAKLDESDYTAESWKPFAAALDAARKVLADPSASQQAVDDALKALTDAQGALVKAEHNGNGGNNGNNGGNGSGGNGSGNNGSGNNGGQSGNGSNGQQSGNGSNGQQSGSQQSGLSRTGSSVMALAVAAAVLAAAGWLLSRRKSSGRHSA